MARKRKRWEKDIEGKRRGLDEEKGKGETVQRNENQEEREREGGEGGDLRRQKWEVGREKSEFKEDLGVRTQ